MQVHRPSKIKETMVEEDRFSPVPNLLIFDQELNSEEDLTPVVFMELGKGQKTKPDASISTQGGKDYQKVGGKWVRVKDKVAGKKTKLVAKV